MARRAFYSFHFVPDCFRAAQVRNMGVIDGDAPVSDNDWEKVKRGGDTAVERWIDGQLTGKSATIVLIGSETASRKWVIQEIMKSWGAGKAVLGVHIHGLKDQHENTTTKGRNPFDLVTLDNRALSEFVKVYDPCAFDSKGVYAAIKDGLGGWIESAIKIRQSFPGATV